MSEQPEVRIGQVWADNDWRSKGRTLMVLDIVQGKALCAVAWPGHNVPKRTTIRLERFKPTSTGYRLIADMPVVSRPAGDTA